MKGDQGVAYAEDFASIIELSKILLTFIFFCKELQV